MMRSLSALLPLIIVSLTSPTHSSAEGLSQAGVETVQTGTNLPVLKIEAKDPIVPAPKVPCTLAFLPGAASETETLHAAVRIRGATSQFYEKKSYALTLEIPAQWLGMRKSTQWILQAAAVDRSLMRHKLSYDLFRSLSSNDGKRYATASRFVEIQINGRYNGAYLLMERVDRALLELSRFDPAASSHACIYKAVDHTANFSHRGHDGYEQQEPEPEALAYWEPLDEFNQFVSRAPDPEFRDPEKGIAARLDLDNAIDFQLLVLLTSNTDGITKNFILARDAVLPDASAPVPRFFFAPWDYDATFGRNWDARPVTPDRWLSNRLFDRLHKDPAFRQQFAARWKQLREREFSVAAIHSLIDENVRTLGDAAQRNATRWRTLDGPYPDRLSFEQDVAQMKEWVTARVQWLDAEIARRANRSE